MLYRYISQIQAPNNNSAVAIGNFDGMHLGHKYIINNLIDVAKAKGLRSCVILFDPQPQQFFAKAGFSRIMSFRDKYAALTQRGVDDVICLKFDRKFANISHQYFYQEILKNKLNMQALIVGGDFHFGKDRLGDLAFLQRQASADDISLSVVAPKEYNLDQYSLGIISSSKVRELIKDNDLIAASKLLGQLYTISAKVIHGEKLGAKLGFKTANMPLDNNRVINNGVYVVNVSIADKNCYGVASVGFRPTVNGTTRLLEVHCFAEVGSIYGARIKVGFIHFLRPEQKFDSLVELKSNIINDIKIAKSFIKDVINQ
jgi:riboflavin kinase / FMN adenylyltransferase